MLRLDNVSAFYGPIQVLFNVELDVGAGEIVALLGTNGAGKTTILRVISGVIKPAAGRVTLDGEPLHGRKPDEILRRGVVQMPGGRGVFPGMTVEENLDVGAFLYGSDKQRIRAAIERVLDLFPALAERRHQVAGSMSGGQQQMLCLAKAFVLEPRVMLVDELSLGLAPKIVDELIGLIRRVNEQGTAVVLVDQHVDLALDVASRAYFLERGQIRFSGPAGELRGRDDLLRSVFLRGETVAAGAPKRARRTATRSGSPRA